MARYHHPRQFKAHGFTIIELLVAVTIIAILTTISTISYLTAQRRARDNASKAEVNTIANGVEAFYAVNKRLPGKVSLTQNPLPTSGSKGTFNALYQNCENIDADGAFVYYYYPYTDASATGSDVKTVPCYNRSSASGSTYFNYYKPDDFRPYPSWIPEMGPYLNPFPVAKNYQGADDSATGDYGEVLQAQDASQTNQTRTIVYRHLDKGYAIYVRLETTSGDSDAVTPNTTISDPPTLPVSNQTVSGKYIYMIRK